LKRSCTTASEGRGGAGSALVLAPQLKREPERLFRALWSIGFADASSVLSRSDGDQGCQG
jgi:hypothetical protein